MTKEEAIKHLHTYSSTNGSGLTTQDQHEEAKKMAIKALETQSGWIPVTERLPEKYDNYLITTKDEDTDIGTFHPEFKQWSICDADGFKLTDGVLAWQPLPKPWENE